MPKQLQAMHLARRLALLLCCAALAVLAIPALAQQELTPEEKGQVQTQLLFDRVCHQLRELSHDGAAPISTEQYHQAVTPLVEEESVAGGTGFYLAGIQALYLGLPEEGIPYLQRAIREYPDEPIRSAGRYVIADLAPYWLARLQRSAGHYEDAIRTYRTLLARGKFHPFVARLMIAEVLSDNLDRRDEAAQVLDEVCDRDNGGTADPQLPPHSAYTETFEDAVRAVFCEWVRQERARIRNSPEPRYFEPGDNILRQHVFAGLLDVVGYSSEPVCRLTDRDPFARAIQTSPSKLERHAMILCLFDRIYEMPGCGKILNSAFKEESILTPLIGRRLVTWLKRAGDETAATRIEERLEQDSSGYTLQDAPSLDLNPDNGSITQGVLNNGACVEVR